MRVLYDHQVFSLQDIGGASRYHYELMRYLATVSDVGTNLFLGVNGTVYPFRELPLSKARVVSFRGKMAPGAGRYIVNEFLGNAIAPFLGKMDIYHPTAYRPMPLVRRRRLVVTHHDCTHERYPEVFRHGKSVPRAKQHLYTKADGIICISEASRQDLLNFHNVDAAKTRVIHHGFRPLPRCPASAENLRERVKREFLLYVGMRNFYKNFGSLLKAFSESGLHNALDLLVLGGGPFTPEEMEQIKGLHVDSSVVSIPRASEATLAEAYAAARLFVYPSLSEGFGFPPLEAMALDCPVLVSNRSSLPEVCKDAPFYFDGGDAESFTHSLLRAVNDEEARRQAVAKGRKVVAQYRWEKCGEETLAFYRECL